MKSITIAATAFACAFGLYGAVAIGQTVPRTGPVQIGTATGDAEKDSIGFVIAEQGEAEPPACAAPRYSTEAAPVGTTTGDPEKDSIGFALLDERAGCGGMAEAGAAER